MTAVVAAGADRTFGPGGPVHPATPGPWKESSRVRTSAEIHSDDFKACVATMAQYIYDRFGKFPATVPGVFISLARERGATLPGKNVDHDAEHDTEEDDEAKDQVLTS